MSKFGVVCMLACALLVAGSTAWLVAQPAPAKPAPAKRAPAKPDAADRGMHESIMSELRVQDFPAVTYLYTQEQTTIAQLAEVVPAMMERVMTPLHNGDAQIHGGPIFVYDGATGEMDKPFTLQVGFPVAPGTKVDGDDLQVRELEKYHCATMIYSGPMQQIGQAYQKLFTDLMEAGLKPAGGSREMHLYFEAPDSPNNIVLIQVAVQ